MKKLLIGLLVVLILIVAVGSFLPTTYRIEERVTIQAAPAVVHEWVGNLKKWDAWSPWLEADPSIVTTFGDQTTGVGASQTWTSKEGDGELTFTKCDPATGIAYDMVFIDGETRTPAVCEMIYEPKGQSTDVVWTMEGDIGDMMPPVVGGYMNIIMKSMISASFQSGLETLKTKAEG